MPLRLFQIVDTHTHKVVPELFFGDKPSAKTKRRELNGGTADKPEELRYVVSPGPDHKEFRK